MIPSPPRSPVPPPVVLAKLGEPDVVRRQRRRSHSDAVQRSESLPRQPARSRTATFRPFSLTASMEKNLQQLHRISKELEVVNQDLTNVIDRERHLSFESSEIVSGDASSAETSSVSLDEGMSRQELSRDFYYNTIQNFEMAGLAFEEFVLVMADIRLSYQIEEKELFSRASCLNRESESFKKMSSKALERLRMTSSVH